MFISDFLLTADAADKVASGIAYLTDHPEHMIKLGIARTVHTSGKVQPHTEMSELYIRLDADRPIITLANGSEMVSCMTEDGRRLDLIFGQPNERSIEPAIVLIEERRS